MAWHSKHPRQLGAAHGWACTLKENAYSRPMKRCQAAILAIFVFVISCSTNDRQVAVNSLFRLKNRADVAYAGYLDMVAAGTISTNNVAEISQHYRTFQSLFAIASAFTALSSNAPPNVEMSNTVSQLLLAIEAEKAKKQ